MRALPLEKPDRRLGAPSNWNHETDGICHTLDIWVRDGQMISAWEPTESERAKIAAGAPVLLFIDGKSHPVVGMAVGDVPSPTQEGK